MKATSGNTAEPSSEVLAVVVPERPLASPCTETVTWSPGRTSGTPEALTGRTTTAYPHADCALAQRGAAIARETASSDNRTSTVRVADPVAPAASVQVNVAVLVPRAPNAAATGPRPSAVA